MSGFFMFPTTAIPKQLNAFASLDRIIVASGSIGLSAFTCAASLAACSIASISALQPAWSSGQTTIGCLRTMSFAPFSEACNQ